MTWTLFVCYGLGTGAAFLGLREAVRRLVHLRRLRAVQGSLEKLIDRARPAASDAERRRRLNGNAAVDAEAALAWAAAESAMSFGGIGCVIVVKEATGT